MDERYGGKNRPPPKVFPESSGLPEDLRPATFDEEESADLRCAFLRQASRLTLAFALLATFVFLALS